MCVVIVVLYIVLLLLFVVVELLNVVGVVSWWYGYMVFVFGGFVIFDL